MAADFYNGEIWDKNRIAMYFCMGDPSLDYAFRDHPPETLTEEDFLAAMDAIFERAETMPESDD